MSEKDQKIIENQQKLLTTIEQLNNQIYFNTNLNNSYEKAINYISFLQDKQIRF